MIKYQNYKHYKLPISINPLEYGKLIYQDPMKNIFIIQINKTNIALITQLENLNNVKFFKEGDLSFEYKDIKTNDNGFIRSLENKRFGYKNNKLVSSEKIILNNYLFIYIPGILNSTTILNSTLIK